MSINDLLGEHTPAPAPRLTPRSPLSIKELSMLIAFLGLVWAAYDKMNHYAEKSAVEKVVETQWLQRLETQHNFDVLSAKVDKLLPPPPEAEKQKHKP